MKKKIVALCLCIALAVVAIGGATLAYFTDTPTAKVNTFTVGNVDIDLTEKGDGNYTVTPGVNIEKDPTVTVATTSEDCWVFVKVEKSADWPTAMGYTIDSKWTQLKDADDNDVTNVYYRLVKKADTTRTLPVLTNNEVTVANTIVNNAFDGKTVTLTVTAYAIQEATFESDPYTAWTTVSGMAAGN